MALTGEDRNTWGKTCPSATLSTTNPTWTDLRSNPGLTKRLSHGTATPGTLMFPCHCRSTDDPD
jgi:hypothetical protein